MPDRLFDLHRKECWTRRGKISGKYPQFLAKNTVPIYMQERHEEVPASVRFPKERVMQEYPHRYYTNHVAFMIALALTEGITHLGLFGINYGHETEYGTQRGSCEFWLGIAMGKGVQIVLPPETTLLRDPPELYGYESHDEHAQLVPSYRPKQITIEKDEPTVVYPDATSIPLMTPPDEILGDMMAEEAEGLRPRMPWETCDSDETGSSVASSIPESSERL